MPRRPIPPEERKRAPGGGRKKTLPDTTDLHVNMPTADVEEMDRLRGDLTRSEFIRAAVREKLGREQQAEE